MKGTSMKRITLFLLCVGVTLCYAAGFSIRSEAASEGKEQTYKGSIKISQKQRAHIADLAKIALADAAQTALAASPGQAVKAGLEIDEDNYLIYSIAVVGADGKITDVKVDAGTGKVLTSEKGTRASVDSKASLAKITLAEAVQKALTASPGQAMKAGLESDKAALIYSVAVVGADGKTTQVKIDAGTGKILPAK